MKKIAISLPLTGEEEWMAVRECFETGWLTQGPKVAEFEKKFALKHQVKHALAVTSCTTGLHLALLALGIGPGDEVLVPAFTWIATANAVLYCGATPILVDIDPDTYNIDPKKIAEKVTSKTKAIIPVHLFGLCADMEAIRKAIPHTVAVIEDAACATGATFRGKYAGGFGDIAVFSFHPRKTLTTGEGGMITTDSDTIAEQIQQLRSHGASLSEEQRHLGAQPYLLPEFHVLGYNYRMTDMQGAIGLVQLNKLDKMIEERRAFVQSYQDHLNKIQWLKLPKDPEKHSHAWQAFVCLIDPKKAPLPRNEIMKSLFEKGINTRPGTHALHTLGLYKTQFGYQPEDFPYAYHCEKQTLALPLHNRMTMEDYAYVIETLEKLDQQ